MTADRSPAPTRQWTERYLAVLGIERRQPTLAALTELIRAHVLRIPFENVTALVRRDSHPSGPVPPPDPEVLLSAWELRAGGGLCFEICEMLVRLLSALGYQAHIVLGHISVPNGHQAIIVNFNDARYLLDPGNGAPLFAPISMDKLPVQVHRHGLSYQFITGGDDMQLFQERCIDGTWTTHCRYDLRPAQSADRDSGYQHHHTSNATWVTGTLTLVRSTPQEMFALRDNTLSRFSVDSKTTQTITEAAQFIDVAGTIFGLPALPMAAALSARARLAANKQQLTSERR